MSKVCIIGQFPPPMHGLSKALNTLYKSKLNIKYKFSKVDIKDNNKFLYNLFKILFDNSEIYYLTISQSKLGNIRDLIIIKLIMLKKRKIVIHLHGGGFRNILDNEFGKIQKKINFKILSKVDAAIVLGKSLKYIFEGIIPENKIFIVENCVDNKFVISDDEFKLKLDKLSNKKEIKILYLSNFIKEKGYENLLEIAKMSKGKENFKFIFAGKFFSENKKKEFFDYIESNELNSIVEYRGIVDGEEKRKLLNECDIFVLLSTYKNEGQPISIIEAIANGLLVITTDHAGIQDIVSCDRAVICKKNYIDNKVIFNELSNITNNPNNIKIYVNKCREFYLDNFTEEHYIKGIESVFESV